MTAAPTKLQAFKEVVHKWLVIRDASYIDVLFGVVFANRLNSKPVWLYLVGPPGSGKTEIVQAWKGCPEVYPITTLTPKALISEYREMRKPGEMPAPDPSLLPKLDGKVLVIKDFTTMLGGDQHHTKEILGMLRDAYDGSCRRITGMGLAIPYKSKFGLIACVTDVLEQHRGLVADLGERFLTYRMPDVGEEEREERAHRAMMCLETKEQETELAKAAAEVLMEQPKVPSVSIEVMKTVARVAGFVAVARTWVTRERVSKAICRLPDPEVQTRLAKQLMDLGRGIAMAREKEEVGEDEITLVKKVALDCLPPYRLRILKVLAGRAEGADIKEIAEALGMSPTGAVYRWLEDLYVLGVLDRCEAGGLPIEPKLLWRLKQAKTAFLT